MRNRLIQFTLASLFLLTGATLGQSQKQPIYVGARACGSCHDGPGMGHQFSKWLVSKHARAYAVLSKPEAKEIARLSGVPQEPQEAAMCLGCHATGADAEEWEHDDGFRLEDGVQCEKCHGPGSEYMDAEVMKDPEAAMRAGLKKIQLSDCQMCHNEKGSHVAVLKLPQLDMQKAWETLAHPTPEKPSMATMEIPTGEAKEGDPGHKFVGVHACGACHRSAMMGFQWSRWRMSAHSGAFGRLATSEAYEIARQAGIEGNPQQSRDCLKCHATGGGDLSHALPSFTLDEGVGCEACHGPGSDYRAEAVMRDKASSAASGLTMGDRELCLTCHENAHGKPFDYQTAWKKIAHPNIPPRVVKEIHYKNPLNLALSPDGRELYVTCEAADSVIVIDAINHQKVAEIPVGGQPHDVAFSPDGRLAFVTNRLDDSLSEIDTASRTVKRTAPVGDEPHAVLTSRKGDRIYVLNSSEDSISILDAATLKEVKRLTASRYPWSMALSPDGEELMVTNSLSRFVPFRTPSISELTVVGAERNIVRERYPVNGTNLLQGIAWHPSGDYALFTLLRTKNLVPMTRLTQGWTITNGLGIAWKDGRVDQVLLDEPDICFPDPADVAISPDGRYAFVSSASVNAVAVVDLTKLVEILHSASDKERKDVLPNDLGVPTEFIVKKIPTKDSPRGIVFTPDSRTAFVANCLDDSITTIDVASLKATERIDLGGPKEITKARRGERLFHNAKITFHREFSCHSCHPDGHVDGITYDIEPDGVGASPVDNRTLRGILDTAPFKWEGTNPSLQRQCGPRLAVFFTRIQPFTPDELSALDLYISTITRPPNRYHPLGADLTPAQRRGKAMFERTMTNDGRMLRPDQQCVFCHPPPLYTNRQKFDVGTKMQYDREAKFDVPHLNNIYDSAPYLHNGIAPTLEEIWTVHNPNDTHGVTNDMTKDQLNDLIEYIKTF